MNRHKMLEHIIRITFPVLSVIIYIFMIAVSFDTFRLDLYVAGYTAVGTVLVDSFPSITVKWGQQEPSPVT